MLLRKNYKLSLSYNYQTYLLFILWISGTIKQYLYAFNLNIDVVIFSAIVVIADMLINIYSRRIKISYFAIKVFLLILLLFSNILISLIYSPSIEYKFEKTSTFLVNILYFVYPFFIKKININKIIKSYLIVILPLSAVYVYFTSIMWKDDTLITEIFREAGFDYLSIGFHLGILLLLLNIKKYPIWLQLTVLLLLFSSAARGPLIITLFVLFVINYQILLAIQKKTIVKMIGISLIIISIFQNQSFHIFENAINRFISLESGNDHSTKIRIDMMQFAFQDPFKSATTFLFGNGIGSFGIIYNNIDARAYPHNIFLEIFFELGLIGTLILTIFFLLLFYKSKYSQSLFATLLLFAVLNALKSSSIIDLWILFSFAGCFITQLENNKKILIKNNK